MGGGGAEGFLLNKGGVEECSCHTRKEFATPPSAKPFGLLHGTVSLPHFTVPVHFIELNSHFRLPPLHVCISGLVLCGGSGLPPLFLQCH